MGNLKLCPALSNEFKGSDDSLLKTLFTNGFYERNKFITLFRSIKVLCGNDSIP